MDEETLQFYRSKAQAYAGWAKAPSTRLRCFLGLLPPDSAILGLCCGAGNHAAVMLAEGFVLRATDGSHEMADVAARRLGHPVACSAPDWLQATYASSGAWTQLSSDTSAIKSFDEAPATMLHVVVRKAVA